MYIVKENIFSWLSSIVFSHYHLCPFSSEEIYSNDLVLSPQRNSIYARVDAALHIIRATSEVGLYLALPA